MESGSCNKFKTTLSFADRNVKKDNIHFFWRRMGRMTGTALKALRPTWKYEMVDK